MTFAPCRIEHHALSITPVIPALPHVQYESGRTMVALADNVELHVLDRAPAIKKLFDRYGIDQPSGEYFAAELIKDGKALMTRPVYHPRWEGALIRMLAVATERGFIQLALERQFLPRRIRVIDCADRKLLVATMPRYGHHAILGAVRDGTLWHPVGEACKEMLLDCRVKSPGEAMLMALQALNEAGDWH